YRNSPSARAATSSEAKPLGSASDRRQPRSSTSWRRSRRVSKGPARPSRSPPQVQRRRRPRPPRKQRTQCRQDQDGDPQEEGKLASGLLESRRRTLPCPSGTPSVPANEQVS